MNKFEDFIEYLRRQNVGDSVINWFLAYQPTAYKIVADLAQVNSNTAFHQWKERAEAELKRTGGTIAQTWAATLVHIAYDQYKAGRANWFKRALRFLFGWVQRAGLVDFLLQYQSEAIDILRELGAVQSNEQLRAVWSEAFALLKRGKQDVKDTWIALALTLGFNLLKGATVPRSVQ